MKRIRRQFARPLVLAGRSSLGVLVVTLAVLGSVVPAAGRTTTAQPASIAGVVRDSDGTPQIGVVVELLRADSSLVTRVLTDGRGIYSIGPLVPGQYALKAVGASFLPLLKQNLRVRTNTVVDLSLSTLYDLMRWAPKTQQPRQQGEDDWAWTLRSASRRPLLRWQEDGSPILIEDGSAETASVEAQRAAQAKRRTRVEASGGGREFGAGPERVSLNMQQNNSARRRFVASADVDSGAAGLMDAMLGFRQEMADSGLGSSSVQTLAAVMVDPEAGAGSQQGLQAASLRTWESLELVNSLEAEAGSDQVLARLGGDSVMTALPFASLKLNRGSSALEYRLATSFGGNRDGDSMPGTWLPVLSERDGQLLLQHGLHQELGWSTSAGPAEMQVVIYGDRIDHPAIEGAGHLTAEENGGEWMLLDRASGLLRTAGPDYSATGIEASLESRLPGNNRVKLSYASGDALVMHASTQPQEIAVIVGGATARRAQMYSVALSGTAEGLGTRWRASYRWQPDGTVTQVAPFAIDASEPYLNIYIRQPIRVSHQGAGSLEAQLDLRNLLAEGYEPFLTKDGSHIYFAQAERCVRGGLAFSF